MTQVIHHFKELCKIPRGSGNEKAVSDYIADFARERGASVVQDEWNNLIISTKGDGAPIILQAHLDMVCEKNADTRHDFAREPIDVYEDGDYLRARGTTLGADNGIGVAMCMALLDGAHPPLEIVLTTEEETGMDGAKNLDIGLLKGTRIINLDSSDEATFTMGCAAGTTAELLITADFLTTAECGGNIISHSSLLADTKTAERGDFCEIKITGLKGGHSGGDIKERANALQILGQFLNELPSLRIVEINGGMKINAIPREATAKVIFCEGALPLSSDCSVVGKTPRSLDSLAHEGEAAESIKNLAKTFAEQFRASEPAIKIEVIFADSQEKAPATAQIRPLTAECTQKIISALLLIPNGALLLSNEIEGLPLASNNIGVAEALPHSSDCDVVGIPPRSLDSSLSYIKISCLLRGATEFFTRQIESQLLALAELIGAQVVFTQRSPAWQYNPNSPLLKTASEVYKELFGRDAVPTAVHGGLECGVFISKFAEKNIVPDIISIGPNAYDYHTPDERVSISSVGRMWEFLCALLERL
ncbi:MAG: M20/M25/M40 family metallo-hydrolase [Defluviitaleaceae bacterium]|nr:M20/M25/M40 family metallo-hydrolase [Defluviitaleaceae bacterium]